MALDQRGAARQRGEAPDRGRLAAGDRARDRPLVDPGPALAIEDRAHRVGVGAAAQIDRDVDLAAEPAVAGPRRYALGELGLVDQAPPDRAGADRGPRLGQDVELGLVVAERDRSRPRAVDAAERGEAVDDAASRRELRRGLDRRRAAHRALRGREAGEVAVDQRIERAVVADVTGDHQRGVGRHVPGAIERQDVVDRGGLDVVVQADREVAQRVALGVERERDREPLGAVRHVLVALAALGADHRLLRHQALAIEVAREVAHALALEPQRERQLVRRQDLVVRGAIGAGRRVGIGRAGPAQHLVVMAAEPIGRALEQVLEQVREPGAIRPLVRAADAVPHADRDLRRCRVAVDHDIEPARQRARAGRQVRRVAVEHHGRRRIIGRPVVRRAGLARLGHPPLCSASASW